MNDSDWDVTSDVSSLFDSTTLPESVPNCSKIFIAHRAVMIVMKVFFMPHIGTQECDKSQLKILCDECAKSFIDPVSDFSNMSMQKIFGLLPAGKSAFAQYYIPSRSSKSESGSEERKEEAL